MEKIRKKMFFMGAGFLGAFVLWTVLVSYVDVRAIGQNASSVGFATLNGYVHNLTGVNMFLYTITDWLGPSPTNNLEISEVSLPHLMHECCFVLKLISC